jgi:hypothetical protein
MRLQLLALAFDRVEFLAYDEAGQWERLVSVEVRTGASWVSAVRFPNLACEAGETLGSDEFDEQVRERASEELVRLEAAVAIASGRAAA